MNKFELFCMIFYVLDAEWDETKNDSLGEFLSSANPFLFEDVGSADPEVYLNFCETVQEQITVENSYEIALRYVSSLDNSSVYDAFSGMEEAEWVECVKDYLSQAHKGSQLN